MESDSISVAVVGATGYTGAELIRLLAGHPRARVCVATSQRQAGRPLREFCPWLASDLVLEPFDAEAIDSDFTFLCQEAGFAMEHLPSLSRRTRVIDLSADFRLPDRNAYETYYRRPQTASDLSPWPIYGLPELIDDADALRSARAVANPGCYPTATLLALQPLMPFIQGTPIIDAKSGVSGAGRSKTETDYLFTELSGGFKPYAVTGHRHTPEIERFVGRPVRFTPHLIPVARGLCATIHVELAPGTTRDTIYRAWAERYHGRPFITLCRESPPSTKEVLGSNRCSLFAEVDDRTGHGVLVSMIDNLVKGASGQAIQNLNLMAGLPEETGLPMNGVWP